MRIEHIAFWTENIEQLANFYATYFGARIGPKYENPAKGFESRFLSFDAGARIEIMCSTTVNPLRQPAGMQRMGLAHVAISVGSRQRVDELTERLRCENVEVVDGPRQTGDGYYESVVLDPDGNRVEVAA
jgi:lactoylglutathione lyase